MIRCSINRHGAVPSVVQQHRVSCATPLSRMAVFILRGITMETQIFLDLVCIIYVAYGLTKGQFPLLLTILNMDHYSYSLFLKACLVMVLRREFQFSLPQVDIRLSLMSLSGNEILISRRQKSKLASGLWYGWTLAG